MKHCREKNCWNNGNKANIECSGYCCDWTSSQNQTAHKQWVFKVNHMCSICEHRFASSFSTSCKMQQKYCNRIWSANTVHSCRSSWRSSKTYIYGKIKLTHTRTSAMCLCVISIMTLVAWMKEVLEKYIWHMIFVVHTGIPNGIIQPSIAYWWIFCHGLKIFQVSWLWFDNDWLLDNYYLKSNLTFLRRKSIVCGMSPILCYCFKCNKSRRLFQPS